ncbi:MAG: hypothetical protein ABI679_15540, partial [Gemmatimonadota bacterium]
PGCRRGDRDGGGVAGRDELKFQENHNGAPFEAPFLLEAGQNRNRRLKPPLDTGSLKRPN